VWLRIKISGGAVVNTVKPFGFHEWEFYTSSRNVSVSGKSHFDGFIQFPVCFSEADCLAHCLGNLVIG
jgi:hypothetical protein